TWRSTRTKDHRWTRAASSPVWAWRITRAPPTRAGRANTAARTSGSSGVAARFRWTTSVRPRRTARKIRDACRNVRPTFPNDMAPGTFAPFGAVFRYVKSTRSASHGSVASSVTNVGIPPWVGGPCPTRSTTGRRPLSSQRSPIPELGEQRLARRTHHALPVARPRPVPAAVRFDPRPAVNVRVLHAPVVFEAVVLQDGGLPRFSQEIEHRAERRLGTGGQLLVPQHETRFRVALAEPLHQTCLLGPERRGPDRNVATGPLDVVPKDRRERHEELRLGRTRDRRMRIEDPSDQGGPAAEAPDDQNRWSARPQVAGPRDSGWVQPRRLRIGPVPQLA